MPRVNPLIPAQNAGEFSPRMVARTDFSKYPLACARCENLIALPQGGLARRPGTRFIVETKDSAAKARLLPFTFSTEQAYIIEAGNGYFRFFRNKGQIVADDTDAVITNGTFDSDILNWDNRSTGGASIAHANSRLSLVPVLDTGIGWAEQDVVVNPAFQNNVHVLRFSVIGDVGDAVELRIGTTSTGNQVIDDLELIVGEHSISFTPGATTFYVQFRRRGNSNTSKAIEIDDVSLIDNVAVELTTPYTTAELPALKFAQTADVMYIAHPDHPIMKLERRAHTSWSLVQVNWVEGPWLAQNADSTRKLTPSASTGDNITVTASTTAGINGGRGFLSTDVGRLIRIRHSDKWGYVVVHTVTNSTTVVGDGRRSFGALGASSEWQLGAWSQTTGYPAGVSFFEQRLVAWSTRGGQGGRPQTFWMSQSADIENMQPDTETGSAIEVQDDDALDFTIAADQVNVILWMSSGEELVLGTTGGEWVVRSDGPVITPTDIDVKRSTTHGSADIQPARVSHVVLFLDRAKRAVREFAFNFDVNAFRAPDMTILADHVLQGGGVEMAYQQDPDSILWSVRSDGQLAALTYLRDQDVVGWARHILGGSFSGGNAVAETVATIPGNETNGTEDQEELWMVVKRTVNGATKRYVEVMEPLFEGPMPDHFDTEAAFDAAVLEQQKDAHYVDSGLIYDGAPTTTLTGLDHLEGESVKILADGAVHPDRTVSSGQVTLDQAASKARVGLGYSHKYKSLKLDVGAAAGTAVGKTKRINGITFLLLHSMKLKQGPAFDDLIEQDFRVVSDAMDTAVPLFTGEFFVEFDGNWDRDARIVVADDAPVPFFMLALAPELKTNDQS